MWPNAITRKSTLGNLLIIRPLFVALNSLFGVLLIVLILSLISAYWGLTSIFNFLISDTILEETTALIPAISPKLSGRLKSNIPSNAPSQQGFDRFSIFALEDEFGVSRESFQQALQRRIISAIEDETAFCKLADLALHAQNDETRLGAVQDLGDIGNERAMDPLIHALNDKNALVRGIALEILGDLADETSVDFLIPALMDTDARVRSNAVRALGKVGGDEIIDALVRQFDDNHSEVRIAVLEVLRNLEGKKAIEFFSVALADRDAQVREVAEFVLADIIGEETDKVLDDSLSQEQDNDEREGGQPATPGLPGYPTAPLPERVKDGEPGSFPSQEGMLDGEEEQ